MQVKEPLDNNPPPPVARLSGVSKIYGEGRLQVKALDQLDLEVHKGDYLAVMGASGSGKSTAMNILGCLDRPTYGSYLLNGVAVEELERKLGFSPLDSAFVGDDLNDLYLALY